MFDQFVSASLAYFDQVVEDGTDQELFVASYLNGHFSLAVSQAIKMAAPDLVVLDQIMQESLKNAFDNQELSEQDQLQTLALWRQLYRQAPNTTD